MFITHVDNPSGILWVHPKHRGVGRSLASLRVCSKLWVLFLRKMYIKFFSCTFHVISECSQDSWSSYVDLKLRTSVWTFDKTKPQFPWISCDTFHDQLLPWSHLLLPLICTFHRGVIHSFEVIFNLLCYFILLHICTCSSLYLECSLTPQVDFCGSHIQFRKTSPDSPSFLGH